jgi:P-type Cu+ transporter
MTTDPICGMTVNPASAAGKHEYKDQTYYFCSHHCAQKFAEDPEKWVNAQHGGRAAHDNDHAAGATQTSPTAKPIEPVYVCPMDPEVRASRPGVCPKCGMALEP